MPAESTADLVDGLRAKERELDAQVTAAAARRDFATAAQRQSELESVQSRLRRVSPPQRRPNRRNSLADCARGSPTPPDDVDKEVLAVVMDCLPPGPENQMDCGLEILKSAFAQRVQELAVENVEVRKYGREKQQQVTELELRLAEVEEMIQQLTFRSRSLGQERHKLEEQRDQVRVRKQEMQEEVDALNEFRDNCRQYIESTNAKRLARGEQLYGSTGSTSLPGSPSKSGRRSRQKKNDRMAIDCNTKPATGADNKPAGKEWFQGEQPEDDWLHSDSGESGPAEPPKPPFRPQLSFLNRFLSKARKERQAEVQQFLLNPARPEDKEQLELTIAEIQRKPEHLPTRKSLVSSLYEQWNGLLQGLEEGSWADQQPERPVQIPGEVLAVVIGGKLKQRGGLRGIGDQLVFELLQLPNLVVASQSPGAFVQASAEKEGWFSGLTGRYRHLQEPEALVKYIQDNIAAHSRVLVFYTVGIPGSNGTCRPNNDMVDGFISLCSQHGLLSDPRLCMVHTGCGHTRPKMDSYAQLDYGVSKMLQTAQLAEAIYKSDSSTADCKPLVQLRGLKQNLESRALEARQYWAAHPDQAAAEVCSPDFAPVQVKMIEATESFASAVYEGLAGERSLLRQLQLISNRFDVVQVPFMLSQSQADAAVAVFDQTEEGDPWDLLRASSCKQFGACISPLRAALWHLEVARQFTVTVGE